MTDRELLEMAAKAAGIPGEWTQWHQAYGDEWVEGLNFGGPLLWNPLTDDGDALRLAVKLKLEFEWWKNGVAIGREDMPPAPIEHTNLDPYAATRRAIVRAAAEIGRAM